MTVSDSTTTNPLRVLIVEDSAIDAEAVHRSLRKWDHPVDVQLADRAAGAVAALAGGRFDVVLLDLDLPDGNGLNVLRIVHTAAPGTAIVVLTGNEDEELASAAMRSGAQDYLVKGRYGDGAVIHATRFAVERQRRERAERDIAELHHELETARVIHDRLIPAESPTIAGMDVAGRCEQAAAVGGDYFDFVPFKDGRWGFVVADVSQHGLGPSLLMAGTRRALRTLVAAGHDVGTIIALTDEALDEDTGPDDFVTLFLAVLDVEARELEYFGAGHDARVLKADGSVQTLESGGIPLGLIRGHRRSPPARTLLDSGDVLLFLTDGIWEARQPGQPILGLDAVLDVVARHRDQTAKEIVDAIFEAVARHTHPLRHDDDLTVVVAKVL